MEELVSMGFEADQAEAALSVCGGSAERAIDLLLSGGPIVVNAAAAGNAPPTVSGLSSTGAPSQLIQADISQYSFENGRSACTCIALTGATLFLRKPEVSVEFLQTMIQQGVTTYQSLDNNRSDVEHMSAEEILNRGISEFPLKILDQVRQGVISTDTNHPLGLKALLQSCQDDGAKVVLITKTPETVVVGLSPQFVLIDSHPRPHQLKIYNAYAKTHGSLDDLICSLKAIFPLTYLGPDVPEMMTMMYNSFDLYPLNLS